MPVVVTQDCRPYYNYGLHDLTAGTVIPDGEFAAFLLATGAPVAEQSAEPVGDLDGDGVPDGTADEVLAWVGDDPARAEQAIQAETTRDKPRSTLITKLEKIAGGE